MWLPAGGHNRADEDPVQAVLREVLEVTGLAVEVVPTVRVTRTRILGSSRRP